jgi:hypothetical protein
MPQTMNIKSDPLTPEMFAVSVSVFAAATEKADFEALVSHTLVTDGSGVP